MGLGRMAVCVLLELTAVRSGVPCGFGWNALAFGLEP